MTQESLVQVMTAAVVISAIALLAQALMVLGMFRTIKSLQQQISQFLPRAETFLSSTEKALAESQKQIKEVTARATEVLDSTQKQLAKVDSFVEDATARARVQMERLELVLDDTVSRVHHTVVQLNNGVMRPLREVSGLAAGVKAAFQHFLGGGRSSVAQATSDEEMFI